MKVHIMVCKTCGKLVYIEQWLVDEKIKNGQHLFCSHECGKKYYHKYPTEHPHTKKMIKECISIYGMKYNIISGDE